MNRSMPDLPVHHQLPEFTQTHAHQVGDAIQPSHPLSSPSPPAPNPSQHQGLFQWVSSSHQVAKVLEFQLQHQSFQCTPGLISFRMDWLDLLAVQGTLKSLLQHHSSKASIFRHSASVTSHIHNWVLFLLWLHPSFFLELFPHWSPVAYWAPTDLGSSSLVSYHFAFSYCSWDSQGKNAEVVCHTFDFHKDSSINNYFQNYFAFS